MRTKFLRTKYLTGTRIQLHYLLLLMASVIIPLVFSVACLYYLIFKIMAEQLGIPEYIALNLFPVIHKINMILLIGVPPLFVILILWGIVLSHRFAGPIERLEKELKRISHSKDYKARIRVRKGDDIKPVADAINGLLESIERR
ncbi:MAG: HAMP domain-containing protein [Candidatus Omnitrophota bacterium]|nr:HAMP domain-containing protein [Candidatus Omnitrophota bacterium]